ncbi:hypothetical protein HBI46_188360 [Parastagonospora nodorum]|nr:hypothetical protein HBI46_188360 [Parastagonospora nodorum]
MLKVKDLNYPPYEARNPERWRLPNTITKSICLLAGREASTALRIALGGHVAANAAHEATYYEPFTYWDWHGVAPDDTYAREYKRQRMWEHHGGFEVNGLAHGYPTPRERWEAFKKNVEMDRRWVKKIAVAHWMDIHDLDWILTELNELKGLDLSDAPTSKAGVQHPWAYLIKPVADWDSLSPPLSIITWLGVPDCRNSINKFALDLIQVLLQRCTSLRTLSIRGRQSEGKPVNAHDYVCKLPYMIATHVPKSVTTLELRLPFPHLDRLANVLRDSKSSINCIGIDFGAWVQEYPKNPVATNELRKYAIKEAAILAAQKARFEAYEKVHTEILGAGKTWILDQSQFGQGLEQDYLEHAKHAFEHDFYAQESGSVSVSLDWALQPGGSRCGLEKASHHKDLFHYVEFTDDSTLPAMLSGLHQFGRAHKDIELFTLKPEWQEKSMDPVHPFALVQAGAPSDATSMSKVYQWLNSTFKWRPIFDWDSFPGPTPKGSHEALLQRWNLDPKLKPEQLLDTILTQFSLLNDTNIPIHILLGRRHPDKPSLYWVTPTSPPSTMERYLRTSFEFNLKPIAPLISTLSIIYDLRSPISTSTTPSLSTVTCPRPICPWHKTCPFPIHSTWPTSSLTSSYAKQKMANSKPIKMADPSLPELAPNTAYLPPTGHLSQYPEDEETLSIARRNSAFAREAIAWQRFWAEYASRLTGLETLNVRMPKAFDRTGSIKLAGLLDGDKGWAMRAWADECALAPGWSVRNGVLVGDEEEDGGGGEFVRRCWVRRDEDVERKKDEMKEEKVGKKERGKRGALKREIDFVDEPWGSDGFGDTDMDMDVFRGPYAGEAVMDFDEAPGHDMDYDYPYALERGEESIDDPALSEADLTIDDIAEKDKEELQKAVDRVVEAADIVERLEASNTSAPKTVTELEKRLGTVYGKRVRRVARHVWQERMKEYLREMEPADSNVLRATRAGLQARLAHFRPEDIFVEDDEMKNGIGLVKQERNFAAEELERGPEKGPQYIVVKEMQELDELNSLFNSDVDHPGERPDNTDDEDGNFYGRTPPATYVEPVDVVGPTPPHSETLMTPNLDDILSTLQTHGGALTHPHPLQAVLQSIEVSETQSAVTQPGSTTVEKTTSTQIKTENSLTSNIPGIGVGQASHPGQVQDLPKGKLYSSPLPKRKAEIEPGSSPKLGEAAGEKKRSAAPEDRVEETKKVTSGRSLAPHREPDVPPTKKSKLVKEVGEKQGEEPSASRERVEKPINLAKEPVAPLERRTPPPKKTPKQTPSKTPSPPSPPESPTPPPKRAPKQAPPPKKAIKPKTPPSPSPAPVKRPARKRKDPVLAELEGKDQKEQEDVLRKTRTRGISRSRSGTPVPAYKETSEDEDEEGDDMDEDEDEESDRKGKGRAVAKGKGKRKKKADEEWGGGRGKRGKKRGVK